MDSLKVKDRNAWRRWLAKNHRTSQGVWLLFYKKHTRKVSVSYDEAVEEALCYGWIDSTIRRVDDESYTQRFTPRKAASRWSASNLTRMEKLVESGKVSELGMAAYLNRSTEKAGTDAPAGRTEVPSDFEEALKTRGAARRNFEAFPASHQRRYVLWINGARRPDTRKRHILEAVKLIEAKTETLAK